MEKLKIRHELRHLPEPGLLQALAASVEALFKGAGKVEPTKPFLKKRTILGEIQGTLLNSESAYTIKVHGRARCFFIDGAPQGEGGQVASISSLINFGGKTKKSAFANGNATIKECGRDAGALVVLTTKHVLKGEEVLLDTFVSPMHPLPSSEQTICDKCGESFASPHDQNIHNRRCVFFCCQFFQRQTT